jgi:Tfp pilus assembly protein PilF
MMGIHLRTVHTPWLFAALLALACAGCATPGAKETAERPKETTPSKAVQETEAAKEPAASPKPPPPRIPTPSKSEQELEKGIRSYEDGDYKTSAKQLQIALDLGLDARRDQARAHKYLAFINCVTGREKKCRGEFNKALDADLKFELEPAEAGHPIWGPVLRSIKAERAPKAKSK